LASIARKRPSDKGKSELQLYNVGGPFERVQMDILGLFPASYKGNKYLLVISNCFTKWVEAFPLENFKASTTAEVFVNQVVSRFDVPLELHMDQGRNFDSRIFKELSRLLGIKKTRTTSFHPQSNGLVERQHQTLTNYLAKFVSENQRDWNRWIGMSLLAYRSARQETTRISPVELCLGRELKLPMDLIYGSPPTREVNSSVGDYVSKLKTKLNEIHNEVRNRINMKTSKTKMLYDRKARLVDYEPSQKVWFHNPRKIGRAPKLQSNWEGPYKRVRKLNDVVYCIRKPSRHKIKIVHSLYIVLRGQEDLSRLFTHQEENAPKSDLKAFSTTTSVGTTLLKREGSVAPSVCSLWFRHTVLRLSAETVDRKYRSVKLTEDGRLLRRKTTAEWQISGSCRTARF